MSTILKALRRLEDDEASQREQQRAELREHLVSGPASAGPRRVRVWAWLLAIPAAGIMGALVAALLLPVLLGHDSPEPVASAPEAAVDEAASAPELAVAAGRDRSGSAGAEPGPATGPASVASVPAPPPVEPEPLPSVAAASGLPTQTRERAVPPLEIEISDDVAVIERNPATAVMVTQTIWHPRAERRIAVIERLDAAEGGEPLRLREGDRVGSLQLVSIEPTGVVFVHNGVELRRRVGARP
jgi:hypothetical protein